MGTSVWKCVDRPRGTGEIPLPWSGKGQATVDADGKSQNLDHCRGTR